MLRLLKLIRDLISSYIVFIQSTIDRFNSIDSHPFRFSDSVRWRCCRRNHWPRRSGPLYLYIAYRDLTAPGAADRNRRHFKQAGAFDASPWNKSPPVSPDPPQIVSVSGVSMVAAGEDGVLECSADASPAPADMITWHREDFDLSSGRVSTFTRNGTSYLTVHNATKADIGQFQCRADNGVGQATATAALLVKRESGLWLFLPTCASSGNHSLFYAINSDVSHL